MNCNTTHYRANSSSVPGDPTDGLRFDPTLNYAGSTTLAVAADDQGNTGAGGAKTDMRTVVINVSTTNTAPVLSGANNLLLTLEDSIIDPGTQVSGLIAGRIADADAGALAGIAVTAVDNTHGAWQYSTDGGGTWIDFGAPDATTARLLTDDAANFVRFRPTADWHGTVANGITFRAWDQTSGTAGGVADTTTNGGGSAFSAAAASAGIDVVSVNDAPAGANRTVTALEDTAYTFTAADFGFSDAADAPANSLIAVKITTLPAAGTLRDNGVNVTAGQFVSVADINAGKLVFTTAANASGAGYATFTFQVQDGGGTANGGVDLDATPRSMTINVTAVNDAPAGTNRTVTTLEDSAYAFTAADFGFSDASDAPANALTAVKVTTLPPAGTLQNNGVNVTAGQLVSVADINAGKLVFTPAANANGAGYASFTFQVQDDGGVASGGVDLDATPRTLTVNVTSVNDAPAGTNRTVTTLEDSAYVFTAADFGFSDAADSPANALTAVKITALPAAGTLQNNGVNVTGGQFVSVADINAGRLVFTPVANASGAGYASFTFQVQDGGGTANGGIDLDATPRSMTVNVTSVNDAPAGADNTVTTLEDTAYTFTAADFGFADANDGPANALLNVKITALPAAGTLRDNGVNVTAGQFVSVADINAGRLVFTPAANANGAGYASFTFQVQDDGGVANGGVDLDATPRTMTVNVTAANDAPAGANKTVTTLEDIAYTFTAADFGFADALDSPANALVGVCISALPGAGALMNNGVNVTAGQLVSVADINAGNFVFAPAANVNGAAYASFTFQVKDDGGTANGGSDLDATPRSMTVNVTAVNDPPVGVDQTVTTLEDTAYTFTAADFGFTDPNDAPANALTAVRITTLESAGALKNNGANVTAGQLVSVADINAGKFVFIPAANANGAGYATFTFQVKDGGGVANGGVDVDVTPRTLTVNVTPVNDAPAGADKTVTTLEDTPYLFTAADFGFTDSTDAAAAAGANALTAVRIGALPGAGTLQNNGVNVTAGQFVSVADINAGKLAFMPTANASGAGFASFTFQVQDDGGTANGGIDLAATPRTLTVNVTAVNDAPAGTGNTVTTLEDTAYTFTAADFGFTDPADAAGAGGADALTAVKIATLPGAGVLKNNGVNVAAGQFVSLGDINAGKLVFTPAANGNGAAYASFTFQVQDNGGTANGGINLDTVARGMTIAVTGVNDAPAIAGLSSAVTEALVNVTTANNQTEPAVATSGSGSYVVAWTSDGGQDGNGKAVFARRFDSTGNAQGAEIQVNTYFASDQKQPAIAMAADGSLVVAWRGDNGTAKGDIYVRRYDSAGNPLGGEVRANTTVTDSQSQPTIGIDAAGNFVVAWKTLDAVSGAGKGVSAQRFDSTGAMMGAEFQVNTFVAGDQDKPTVAVTADGRFVVAWSSNGQDNGGRGIYAQRYTAAGVRAGGEFRVNTTTANTQDVSSVAMDGAGNFVVAWASLAQDGSGKGIYAQHYDAAGNRLGSEYRVNNTTANDQNLPAVVMSPGGSLVVAWQGNGAGDNSGVFMQLDRSTALMNEDGTLVFSTANGNAVAVTDVDAGAGIVQATLTATDGSVTLAGTAGLTFSAGDGAGDATMTFTGTLAAINAALDGMSFAPAPDFNGRATLSLAVDDLGNTGSGGALTAGSAIAISVVAVNDAPAGASATVTAIEDTPYIFSAGDFGFSDPADVPADALLAVRVTALPGAGSLTDNGVAVAAGQVVARADIDAGKLAFTPGAGAVGPAYAQFTFEVEDDGGTANGGVDFDAAPRVMTLDVAPANNAPVLTGANDFAPIAEDAAANGGTLVSALIAGKVTDADAAASSGIAVTAVDNSNGTWQYFLSGGAAWTDFGAPSAASARLLAADAGTYVRFVPDANWHGSVAGGITFRAWDQASGTSGATANTAATGGTTAFSAAAASSGITVNSVNDMPLGADNAVTILEDTAYTFSAADFGLTDAGDSPANALLAVEITAAPASGTLQKNGVNVNPGQFVAAADINSGKLMFIPAAGASGAGYASFTFRVQDDGGVANGGIDLDATARTMTVNVLAVNDAPAGAAATVTTLEGTTYVFSVADFGFTDTNDAIADAFAAVRVTTLPGAGSLSNNGIAVTAGQLVSVAEIVTGKLAFTPAAGASGNGYASFSFQVKDSGGTANGGVDLDPAAKAVTVNVIATTVVPIGPPPPVIVPVVTLPPAPPPVTPPAPAPVTSTPAVSVTVHSAPGAADPAAPAPAATSGNDAGAARADAAAAGGQVSAGSAPAGVGVLKGLGLLNLQWFNVTGGDQPGFLSANGGDTPAEFKLVQAVNAALQQPAFERALDKARESAQEQVQQEERVVSAAIMGSTGLSVGYLVWLLRSGALISSLLSSLPAWRTLDPFPVLSHLGEEEEDEDDDSLEALVAKDSGAPVAPKPAGDA